MPRETDAGRGPLLEKLNGLAGEVAVAVGAEVVLLEIKGEGGRSVIRVFIDHPGGVTLELCERFSKRLSVLLDVEDCVPFSYVLEVSSPGINRPLVKLSDFERFAGQDATVRTRLPVEGQRKFKGRILGVRESRVGLELAPGRKIEIEFSGIEKANLSGVL
jgi:ribosome maturation factor RimP